MGQEIDNINFTAQDYTEFNKRLKAETELLGQMLRNGEFDHESTVAGYELEAWLLDKNAKPVPQNDLFLQNLKDPEVVAELAKFNIELNGAPRALKNNALSRMQDDLGSRWNHCQAVAKKMEIKLLAIGILPTVRNSDLCLENISSLKRYLALNQEVLKLRGGQPLYLDITGKESLNLKHNDVMLEAAATSFQIHLQVDSRQAANYYNLAKIISAPLVGLSSNSPYLFAKELWAETRIPLFEQAVSVGGAPELKRVTFGMQYLAGSIQEIFDFNVERYPVLLPIIMDTPLAEFSHLRLHNGTLWRWNRPLVGFNLDGTPHIRIEQRVIPAGPSQLDQMANAAFFFGLITYLAGHEDISKNIPHINARNNFYTAAKFGLEARIIWVDGKEHKLAQLCLVKLLPQAEKGLIELGIDQADIVKYLGVIESRMVNGQTGSVWQKAWVDKYGADWQNLVLSYAAMQQSGQAVHTWEI